MPPQIFNLLFILFSKCTNDRIISQFFSCFSCCNFVLCSGLARFLSEPVASLLSRDFPSCHLGLPLATFPRWICFLDHMAFCFLGFSLSFYWSTSSFVDKFVEILLVFIQTSHSLTEEKVQNNKYRLFLYI